MPAGRRGSTGGETGDAVTASVVGASYAVAMADGNRPDGQDAGGRVVVEVEVPDAPFCATGVDLIADRLFALGAAAVAEPDVDDSGTIPTVLADLPLSSLPGLDRSGVRYTLVEVDPTVTSSWQEHATSVEVGDRLVVRPVWVDTGSVAPGRIEVVVDAGDSFGSGSHPTTQLCLRVMERIVRPGDRVLDVGCGTGVLGVAALLLGAGSLVAVDLDPSAVTATGHTAALNLVTDRVAEVSARSVEDVTEDHGPFDLVLANLLIPVVEELGHELVTAVASEGHLVVSGLLPSQADRALAAVGAVRPEVDVFECDGWAAAVIGPSHA